MVCLRGGGGSDNKLGGGRGATGVKYTTSHYNIRTVGVIFYIFMSAVNKTERNLNRKIGLCTAKNERGTL